MDGALYSSVVPLMRARQELYYADGAPGDGPRRELLADMDWSFGVLCGMHCCSNGVKWALTPWATDTLKDDAHITIASLRNSSCDLHGFIDVHLQRNLRFRERPLENDVVLEFWLAATAGLLAQCSQRPPCPPRDGGQLKIIRAVAPMRFSSHNAKLHS